MVRLVSTNLTTKRDCLSLSKSGKVPSPLLPPSPALGSLPLLSSRSRTALTNAVGGLLQQLNLDVPGTRWDLHLFESRCHPGASRKAKSPERVAPCSAPSPPHPTLPHSTRTSHTQREPFRNLFPWLETRVRLLPAPPDP